MLATAISHWSGLSDSMESASQKITGSGAVFFDEYSGGQAPDDPANWATQFLSARAVLAREDARMRSGCATGLSASDFDGLRKSYEQPDEWTGREIKMPYASATVCQLAADLGLKVTP